MNTEQNNIQLTPPIVESVVSVCPRSGDYCQILFYLPDTVSTEGIDKTIKVRITDRNNEILKEESCIYKSAISNVGQPQYSNLQPYAVSLDGILDTDVDFYLIYLATTKTTDKEAFTSAWSSVLPLQIAETPEFGDPIISKVNNDLILNIFPQGEDAIDWIKFDIYYLSNGERKLIETSGYITEKTYTLKYNINLHGARTYQVYAYYKTQKGYRGLEISTPTTWGEQNFGGADSKPAHFTLSAQELPDICAVELTIESDNLIPGALYIQRLNMQQHDEWETVCSIPNYLGGSPYSIFDTTLQTNLIYLYRAYIKYDINSLSQCVESESVFVNSEDIILTDKTGSIRIAYNPDVTSFKYTVQDAVLQPLSSKFPVIKRNGNTMYRQFNISGLISYNSEIYDEAQITRHSLTPNFPLDQRENYILPHSLFNTIWLVESDMSKLSQYTKAVREGYLERLFRDKVVPFLYDDSVKIFKSPTEGNMLVRLTNVSLTPNKQLGRNIYSFSAQCTEVAEYTIENIQKYNIPLSSYKSNIAYYSYYLPLESSLQEDNENGIIDIREDQIEINDEDATLIIERETFIV